jgi:hypothetical protein
MNNSKPGRAQGLECRRYIIPIAPDDCHTMIDRGGERDAGAGQDQRLAPPEGQELSAPEAATGTGRE